MVDLLASLTELAAAMLAFATVWLTHFAFKKNANVSEVIQKKPFGRKPEWHEGA